MSGLILVWLVLAVIMEHLIVVAPLDVKSWYRLVAYYVLLAPYLALIKLREWLGPRLWLSGLTDWFKKS